MLNRINLIRYIYSKISNIFAWSNFFKIRHVLIHQISWMKNKSHFKSPQRRKIKENKTTNESTWNIFVARFSFGVLASLIFIIYFVISSFTKTQLVETFKSYPQFYTLSPLLNGIEKGEYTPNTWLIRFTHWSHYVCFSIHFFLSLLIIAIMGIYSESVWKWRFFNFLHKC